MNLTAHPLELRTRVDFKGGVWKYPAPSVVAPEKGANFLHVGGLFGFGGSSGGLSYATQLFVSSRALLDLHSLVLILIHLYS